MIKDEKLKEITKKLRKMTPSERKALISFALKLKTLHSPKPL